ncbi:allantoate amidohydrolase [Pseudomonas psychrotolerans L19]|uniref:N-carbamoyl-L-amino-acid hydrolase n=1 Tax=Pseudomonas oryzihabitans TaxID=47885 RepID=A0A178LGK3_9PSED|nr:MULTISPECIES: Zn-dependent hydrolase [Pseudomonas]EHK68799.1 allantoate amidohydrolase [Pseudomonas psychrotolerans L19]MBA1182966.1 Zn-dependent hydrolase [Pseudomonas psychrotolerans]MBA1214410.1 Zn-dependent hydrolase [Pseudomonas psychrotolerans]MDC7832032.1 Zn-dependent hydrolase [Pseudomonas benzopyrenica]NMY92429.1 Zn-dependent hydrolase [Pseudomonas psychrotolerans]
MLEVNGERLWNSLMEMAAIGATAGGGNSRLALTEEDRQGRALFVAWCEAAGLSVQRDAIGNLFARRQGRDADAAPVVMGSHLDTQPKGGRFDGIFGVLAALEVIRRLNEENLETRLPLEIAVWTNEEGARFTPAMLGSAVFTGALPLARALATEDRQGVSIAQALASTGEAGERALQRPLAAYFEAHIEQGPVLEAAGLPIGVVTGGQAICWLDVRVGGTPAHAGTTPMAMRKDALFGVGEMLAALETLASEFAPAGLVTVGQVDIAQSSRNTIAGQVDWTLDLRHPDDAQLAALEVAARERLAAIATRRGLTLAIERHWLSPATPFAADCVQAVRDAVQGLGYGHQEIISGAGHDAIHLARHCPTSMIFIPCRDGLSHNEAEWAEPFHIAQGAAVLLNAVLAQAGH